MVRGEWRVKHFGVTASTNILAHSGAPGDVFTADFQTAGRGRLDHRWESAAGRNLIMSAVVDVSGMDASHVATLPLATGLAVAEALRPLAGGNLALKWPNDILSGNRKLGGILCERSGDSAIVGIGVNVMQSDFPAELSSRATSLALLGSGAAVPEVRDAVLAALSRVLGEWRSLGFSSIWPRISALDWLKGRSISVTSQDGAEPFASGECGGIQSDGSLLVGGSLVWAGEAHVELPRPSNHRDPSEMHGREQP